jgi:hypothetical protein
MIFLQNIARTVVFSICNKIFLGYQPRQLVEWRKNQHFEDHLHPYPQDTEVTGTNQPTQPKS